MIQASIGGQWLIEAVGQRYLGYLLTGVIHSRHPRLGSRAPCKFEAHIVFREIGETLY